MASAWIRDMMTSLFGTGAGADEGNADEKNAKMKKKEEEEGRGAASADARKDGQVFSHDGLKRIDAWLAASTSGPAGGEKRPNGEKTWFQREATWPTDQHGQAAQRQFRRMRENKLLASGCVMLAETGKGDESRTPQDGDLLLLEYKMRAREENSPIIKATPEGVPEMFIYGSGRMLRGWEIAMGRSSPGSKLFTKIAPALAYGDENYRGSPPPLGAGAGDVIITEIMVVAIYPKSAVAVVPSVRDGTDGDESGDNAHEGEEPALYKVIQQHGDGWESPRAPFKVVLQLHARYVPPGVGSPVECLGDGGLIEYTLGSSMHEESGGMPEMLECVERAVETMLVGERCTLAVTDPSLVRPSSVLPGLPRGGMGVRIDIELHKITQVRDVFGDALCFKTRCKEGVGEFPVDCPLDDCDIIFHLIGKVVDHDAVGASSPGDLTIESEDGPAFVDTYSTGQPISATLGMSPLPKALDTSLRLMTQGEVSHVLAAPRYAYDDPTVDIEQLRADHGLPASRGLESTVLWRVELVSFVRMKSKFDPRKFRESITGASLLREQGNQHFREGKLEPARLKYEAALRELKKALDDLTDDADPLAVSAVKKPLALCMINLAAVAQKQGESQKSIEFCTGAIGFDSTCAKAYYRRGMALMAQGSWEGARKDFVDMAERDPELAGERDACLQKLDKRKRDAQEAEKKQAKAMLREDGASP